MTNYSLPITELCRRLAECPAVFLDSPKISEQSNNRFIAIVNDTIRALGGDLLTEDEGKAIVKKNPDETISVFGNRLRLIAITCWVLMDPAFCEFAGISVIAHRFFLIGFGKLPELVAVEDFIRIPERREELIRRVLKQLGISPKGETTEQSEDRLAALDSVETQRVINESRAAQKRNRAVIEAMQRRAAEEAAAKVTRE